MHLKSWNFNRVDIYSNLLLTNPIPLIFYSVRTKESFAARVITKKRKFDSISSTIGELGWRTMDKKPFAHRVNQIHKYLQGNTPQYLTETLTISNNVHQNRTRQSNELHSPLAKTNSMKRAFNTWDLLTLIICLT